METNCPVVTASAAGERNTRPCPSLQRRCVSEPHRLRSEAEAPTRTTQNVAEGDWDIPPEASVVTETEPVAGPLARSSELENIASNVMEAERVLANSPVLTAKLWRL